MINKMKQTAVELLEEKLNNIKSSSTDMYGSIKFLETEFKELFKQAKEMEKQKQGYTEEEVLNIIDNFCETFKVDLILREDFNQWFDQFKNK